MAQNREPPAFQMYAASMMARTEYRVMSLLGRGLLMTLLLECWVNRELPADEQTLARVLHYPVELIGSALPELSAFFSFEGGKVRCPDLEDYRAHLNQRREKQSKGGRKGAAKTNRARDGAATSTPTSKPRAGCESLVQINSEKKSQKQANQGGEIHDEWINDYERASRGH